MKKQYIKKMVLSLFMIFLLVSSEVVFAVGLSSSINPRPLFNFNANSNRLRIPHAVSPLIEQKSNSSYHEKNETVIEENIKPDVNLELKEVPQTPAEELGFVDAFYLAGKSKKKGHTKIASHFERINDFQEAIRYYKIANRALLAFELELVVMALQCRAFQPQFSEDQVLESQLSQELLTQIQTTQFEEKISALDEDPVAPGGASLTIGLFYLMPTDYRSFFPEDHVKAKIYLDRAKERGSRKADYYLTDHFGTGLVKSI